MKTNNEFKFPYFLVGMGLGAIAGLLLAPRSGGDIRKYLRERSKESLVSRKSDSVDTPTEGERLAYEEKRRENMGG